LTHSSAIDRLHAASEPICTKLAVNNQMLDYKSLSNDELYKIIETVTTELRSRRDVALPPSSQGVCTIIMRRTKRGEPHAMRFTNVDGVVVEFPLTLDQIVGKSGNVLRGDFLLEHGDVVWKTAANGISEFIVAWPGTFEDGDPDLSPVFRGRTEAEITAKIEVFVRGNRTLIVNELMDDIEFWEDTLLEYHEQGKTSDYWRNAAKETRSRIASLNAMLRWAKETSTVEIGADRVLSK
jgi:hypothetical protein